MENYCTGSSRYTQKLDMAKAGLTTIANFKGHGYKPFYPEFAYKNEHWRYCKQYLVYGCFDLKKQHINKGFSFLLDKNCLPCGTTQKLAVSYPNNRFSCGLDKCLQQHGRRETRLQKDTRHLNALEREYFPTKKLVMQGKMWSCSRYRTQSS